MEAIHDPVDPMSNHGAAEGVGAMLRERRIALGLSQADVANVVKLPVRRIEAMERERWDELPDGPYLRGFLKNIARALNLDAATLIDRVDESLMRARNPDSILVAPGSTHAMLPRRSGPAEGRYSGRSLVAGAMIFALIAALIAWSGTDSFDRSMTVARQWLDGQRAPVAGSTPAETKGVPKATAPQTTSESVPLPPLVAATQPAPSTASVASPLAAPSDTPNGPAAAAGGSVAIQFHFSEDAWVEVRGGDGKLLMSQLNVAGSDQSVEGQAPFSVVVGNARAVSLTYRGRPVDLTPYIHDQVARLTLS